MAQGPDPFNHLDALERALNGFAGRVSRLWILYLLFAAVLLIRALTVNHRELLFDEPLKLGIEPLTHPITIEQPLYWFFALGPIMFVLVHFFLMVQVWLLSHTAAAYNEIINKIAVSDRERELIRLRLTDSLLAQILVGATRERWLDWLLRAIAWITLALLPIGIIVVFQFKFLPYHDHGATWTHRLLLFAGLAIVFVLFPLVFDAGRVFSSKKVTWQAARVAACVSFGAVSLSLAFPGERHLDLLKNLLRQGNSPFCETILNVNDRLEVTSLAHKEGTANFQGRDLSCGKFDESDFSGFQFTRARMRGASFANAELHDADFNEALLQGGFFSGANLELAILTKADLNDAQFIGAVLKDARLAGATLSGAILSGAKLEGAILSEAKLDRAYLDETRLERARLAEVNLKGAQLLMAQLEGANLSGANLPGAELGSANLNNAVLNDADLQKADLFEAGLLGAKLINAKLQRAHLLGADLERADLHGAKLQGANLSLAKFQGADLSGAKLQGADLSLAKLRGADLSGADLTGARLQDADLSDAQLHGVKLQAAKLQGAILSGADLTGAQLQGADLSEAKLQRATLSNSKLELARIFDAQLWSAKGANCSEAYVKGPKFEAPTRQRAPAIVARVRATDERESANWRHCEESSKRVAETQYRQQLADLLREIVCDATADGREIADAIVRNDISDDPDRRDFSSRLAYGLLGSDGKPCAADLSDETQKLLLKYAPPTTPVP
jgi:uncharacterized protein YjbI with pentapeptide repeats